MHTLAETMPFRIAPQSKAQQKESENDHQEAEKRARKRMEREADELLDEGGESFEEEDPPLYEAIDPRQSDTSPKKEASNH